jgi:hypothetical protein
MNSEREIDDAIDRAVREIMSVEPRAGLRGRVLAVLESGGAGRMSFPRLAGAAAALAVGILVFFIWSRPSPDPVRPATMAGNEPADAAAPPRAPSPVPAGVPESLSGQTLEPAPSARRSGAPARPPRFPAPGKVTAANLGARPMADATLLGGTAAPSAAAAVGGAPEIFIPTIQIQPLIIDTIVIDPIRPPR